MKLLLDSHDEAFVFLYFIDRLGYKNAETGELIPFNPNQLMNFMSMFGTSVKVDTRNRTIKNLSYDENEDRDLDTYSSLAQFLVKANLSKEDIQAYLTLHDDKQYKLYEIQSEMMINGESTIDLNGVYLEFMSPGLATVLDEVILINDAFFQAVLKDSTRLKNVKAVFLENEVLVDIDSLMYAIPFIED